MPKILNTASVAELRVVNVDWKYVTVESMGVRVTSQKGKTVREPVPGDFLQGIIVGNAVRLVRVYIAEVRKFGCVLPDFCTRIGVAIVVIFGHASRGEAGTDSTRVPASEKLGLVKVSGIHLIKPIVANVGYVER